MKYIYLIVILLLIASCSQTTSVIENYLTPTNVISTVTDLPSISGQSLTLSSPTLSTLPLKDAQDMIIKMHQRNPYCLLPCWFNLIPGETDKQSAKPLLDNFTIISLRTIFKEDVGSAFWRINEDGFLLDTLVSFTYDTIMSGKIENIWVTIEVKTEHESGGFETAWDNPLNTSLLSTYMLSETLTTYSKPQQVFVFANEGWNYFSLILDYSDRGFAIWYSAPLESSGDKYFGCMSRAFTNLYIWDPEFSYTWVEGIVGNGDKYEIESLKRDFQPLERVTSMTLNEFYNIFTTENNSKCIETSKLYWPGP